ncbi:MAG: DUF4440 domain-containing protein [Methylococcus sp.]|nr:DUF4440 domain-containing protein [Methylococcus sp.]
MSNEALRNAIHQADQAINCRDFDRLMNFYAEDAMLVIAPERYAKGKTQIRKAFDAISGYFNDSLEVEQGNMIFFEMGDIALVLAKTFVRASGKPDSQFSSERDSTYVYRKAPSGQWLCVIDNSYGTALLNQACA